MALDKLLSLSFTLDFIAVVPFEAVDKHFLVLKMLRIYRLVQSMDFKQI